MNSNENKKPIITENINLTATKGVYSFFCKSTAKPFAVALDVLKTAKNAVKGANAEKLVSCLWTVNHTANKLEGITSISSSVHDNCYCKARRADTDSICSRCYAHSQQSYQTGLKEHNILNGIILRNVLLPVSVYKILPILFPVLRIESFGDVQNVTQARNYIRIIKANPRKRCAVWTKNISTWHTAFVQENGKPKNTTFVISSPYLNTPIPETILERFPEVDHIFTVYDKKYIRENGIKINCGGKKCMECIKQKKNCYFRNTELYINEELK